MEKILMRLITIALLVGLVGAGSVAYAQEGEVAETLFLDVTRDTPPAASLTVASAAIFSVTFKIANDSTAGDAGRTMDGGYTLTSSGLTLTSGPATSGTFTGLAKGSPIYFTWIFQAPTGPAGGSVTLSASVTSISPHRAYPTGGDKASDSIGYNVTVLPPASPAPTTTAVSCVPNPVILNGSTSCTATVTDATTPQGVVLFSSDKAGTFTPNPCTLSAGVCTVDFTPTEVGPHTITGTYTPTSFHLASFGSTTLNVHYKFLGLLPPYVAPPRAFKMGSSIPLKWQYANAANTVVYSAAASPQVIIKFVDSSLGTGEPLLVEDPGNSGLRYDSTTDMWINNWQTKGLQAGIYHIWISSVQTGQMNGPFPIELR